LKSDAGERDLDLTPELAKVLRTHKLASSYAKDDDFVFTTLTGQPIYYRNASARGLQKAADRAGLNGEGLPKLSFHDLGHTAITHLIRAGTDVAQVQRFAGHAKPSITLDIYVGEFEARKSNDVGQRLSAAFTGVL
jgi:integrase